MYWPLYVTMDLGPWDRPWEVPGNLYSMVYWLLVYCNGSMYSPIGPNQRLYWHALAYGLYVAGMPLAILATSWHPMCTLLDTL